MKPFNKEEALAGKPVCFIADSKFKVTEFKEYILDNGDSILTALVTHDDELYHSTVKLFTSDGCMTVSAYRNISSPITVHYFHNGTAELTERYSLDTPVLCMMSTIKTVYVNLYEHNSMIVTDNGIAYDSEEQAHKNIRRTGNFFAQYIKTVPIEIEY